MVNIASLPSTVTRVSGNFSHFMGGGFCADATNGDSKPAHSNATRIRDPLFIFGLMSYPDLPWGVSSGPVNFNLLSLQALAALGQTFRLSANLQARFP